MALQGTIVALASPMDDAERAVVRISGTETRATLLACCDLELGPHRAVVRTRLDIGAPIGLPVAVLWSPGPRSYTGEDAAEVLCAGGRLVASRVVTALLDASPEARPAEAGEFTARAFLNGRLSAEASEGVEALISASSLEEAASARRLVSGVTGETYRALADDLAASLALVEAGIDFTDEEDVVAIEPDELRSRLRSMIDTIDGLVGPQRPRAARTGLARVVLAGVPSAGKSTLFNRLLGRERAVTDAQPGTTRDTLVEEHTFDARARAELCDLAGLDEALSGRSIADARAQEQAHAALGEADVVVWCDPDGRFETGALDVRPLAPDARLLRVRTKGDLASDGAGGLSVCALDGSGVPPLERAIADALAELDRSSSSGVVARHDSALREARAAMTEALGLGDDEEIAGSMRAALDALTPIAGRVHPDDVIGRIFATFCIGK